MRSLAIQLALLSLVFGPTAFTRGEEIKLPGGGILVQTEGSLNSVRYAREKTTVHLYQGGAPGDILLLTDGRRDLVADTLVRSQQGEPLPTLCAPAKATYWLSQPNSFWRTFVKTRFHDYAQQTTKVPAEPLPIERWLKEGDLVEAAGLQFRVIETPGYTRSGISYILDAGGKRIAFTGDLIVEDGRILDLYSFQDAIPSAQIRGYHGYGSRLSELVASLRKLREANPDLIVPARGKLIDSPLAAIDRLTARVQSLYANYLSTNALHWYFKEQRMTDCGKRVLGDAAEVELMPYSRHEQTPDWVYENSTSRLLISESGNAFLLDCGYQRVIDAIQKLQSEGLIKKVEGIFVTHYHDDHTDSVQAAAEAFDCPVYATREYADVLERPDAYHLPAMTANPISPIKKVESGHRFRWREFDLAMYFFPGQTFYHGALWAKKAEQTPILFVGDAFAPSGMDDYCVLNRNLLGADQGFLKCLDQIRSIDGEFWLVNEHIRHVFRFAPKELDYLETRYRRRIEIQKELYPFDAPNYGVDEQWAWFYPYASRAAPKQTMEVEFRVWNHSPKSRTFRITPRAHQGVELISAEVPVSLTLDGNSRGRVRFSMRAPANTGVGLITADVQADVGGSSVQVFPQWAEAMVIVGDPSSLGETQR